MTDQLMFDENFENLVERKKQYPGRDYESLLPEYKNYINDIIQNKHGSTITDEESEIKYIRYGTALIFEVDKEDTFFYLIGIYSHIINVNKYKIEKDGIINLRNNNKHLFDELKEENFEELKRCMDREYLLEQEREGKFIPDDLFDDIFINYIYKDNLSDLKYSSYFKYLPYEEYIDYLEKQEEIITIRFLINNPICYKSFEFLLKKNLYKLSDYGWIFDYDKELRDIFKKSKEIVNYIIDNNMTLDKLLTFKLLDFNIDELESFRCIKHDNNLIRNKNDDIHSLGESEAGYYWLLSKRFNNIGLNKYLLSLIQNKYTIEEYYDYIKVCDKLGIDLNIKENLIPSNFGDMYTALTAELSMLEDNTYEEKNKKINDIGELVNKLNQFEDDKYVIYACNSMHDLIQESIKMHNCVRLYYKMIADGTCQIYFMRDKSNVEESLVTVEVIKNKITQAYGKYNSECTEEEKEFLKKFENVLVNCEIYKPELEEFY